ncbi:MAG: arginine--tRNA ligase [Anaerococcus sp.]|nr:arginine--tRNA ligase [Anaerococcus sp.]
MTDLKEIIAKELESKEIGLTFDEIYKLIEIPPQDDMGDFSFPCFSLAKLMRKNPALIAKDLASEIKLDEFAGVKSINAYVNFFVDRNYLAKNVIGEILDKKESYGRSDEGKGKKVVIEFSSVNIAKPFHIGHIRSTVIGDALRNIHEFLSYDVLATNYIGDYGTQFGTMIAAYRLWGDKEAINKDPINELLKLYVRYNNESNENPSMKEDARAAFKALEDGEEDAVSLWEWFKEISLKEFEKVYGMLDIKFDNYDGESFHSKYMQGVLDELREKDLLVESDGALIVDLKKYDLTPAILVKSNGSSAYITRDVATAIYRKKTYDFDKNLYVVATQQNLHFKQLRKILELMGYDFYKDCLHIPFGMVSLKDQTMSTRKGQVVFLEDVLTKAIDKTKEIMEERSSLIENIDETAKIVGIGAVKFNELYNNRIKDYVFDWDELLNFDGETGPYVQYTYARAKSVLRKAGYKEESDLDFTRINSDVEFTLIKSLEAFKDVIIKSREKYEPSLITRQVSEIAKNFNKFYNQSQIMVDDKDLKKQRLALTYASAQVIKIGLNLLGIKTVEKM